MRIHVRSKTSMFQKNHVSTFLQKMLKSVIIRSTWNCVFNRNSNIAYISCKEVSEVKKITWYDTKATSDRVKIGLIHICFSEMCLIWTAWTGMRFMPLFKAVWRSSSCDKLMTFIWLSLKTRDGRFRHCHWILNHLLEILKMFLSSVQTPLDLDLLYLRVDAFNFILNL